MNEDARPSDGVSADLWRRAGTPGAGTAAAVFVLACVIFVLRRPDILFHAQLWAEDGTFWFAQSYNRGFANVIFSPHTGYLQTFSRLVFSALVPMPLEHVPAYANAVGVAVRAWCVALLFARDFGWFGARAKLLLAAFMLLQPGLEAIHANITNTHWYLAILALLVVVADRPTGRGWIFHDMIVLAIAGLSGPFCIFLLPALAVRLLGLPFRAAVRQVMQWLADPRLLVLGAVSAIQLGVMLVQGTATRSKAPLGASFELLSQVLATRIFAGFVLPPGLKAFLWQQETLCVAITIVGLGILIYALLRGPDRLKTVVVFAALMMVPLLLSPQIDLREEQWPVFAHPHAGLRYFVIAPIAWFAVLIWLAAEHARKRAALLATAAFAVIVALAVDGFRISPVPDTGYYEAVAKIDEETTGLVKIPIAPQGWEMILDFGAR